MLGMTEIEAGNGCQGCGGEPAVVYEDVPLCGSCFYIASLTTSRRVSRLLSSNSSDRVTETATMIASLVDSLRNGDRHGR